MSDELERGRELDSEVAAEYKAVKDARSEVGSVTYKKLETSLGKDGAASVKSKIENLSTKEVETMVKHINPHEGRSERSADTTPSETSLASSGPTDKGGQRSRRSVPRLPSAT